MGDGTFYMRRLGSGVCGGSFTGFLCRLRIQVRKFAQVSGRFLNLYSEVIWEKKAHFICTVCNA